MSFKIKEKKFYFHIDDFGVHKIINKQIANFVQINKVKGVSILTHRGADFTYLHKIKKVDLSLHINLTSFQKKTFSYLFLLLISAFPYFFKKQIEIIKKKINYQITKFIKLGLNKSSILRIDGHNHIHVIPIVFSTYSKILKEKKIKFNIRDSREKFIFFYSKSFFCNILLNYIKLAVIFFLSFFLLRKKQNIFCGENFIGLICSGFYNNKSFKYFIKKITKKKVTQFLLHPFQLNIKRTGDLKSNQYDYYFDKKREIEIEFLKKINI